MAAAGWLGVDVSTMEPALFLEPASVVPMSAQVGFVLGHHHQVECSRRDRGLTTGADIRFAGSVGLHRHDDQREKMAHAIAAAIAIRARTIVTTSALDFGCGRKGLNPTGPMVGKVPSTPCGT